MGKEYYVVKRTLEEQIWDPKMLSHITVEQYLCDVSLALTVSWVDKPDVAAQYTEYEIAEQVVKALASINETPFTLSVETVRVYEEES